jgi:hypothetical protein
MNANARAILSDLFSVFSAPLRETFLFLFFSVSPRLRVSQTSSL